MQHLPTHLRRPPRSAPRRPQASDPGSSPDKFPHCGRTSQRIPVPAAEPPRSHHNRSDPALRRQGQEVVRPSALPTVASRLSGASTTPTRPLPPVVPDTGHPHRPSINHLAVRAHHQADSHHRDQHHHPARRREPPEPLNPAKPSPAAPANHLRPCPPSHQNVNPVIHRPSKAGERSQGFPQDPPAPGAPGHVRGAGVPGCRRTRGARIPAVVCSCAGMDCRSGCSGEGEGGDEGGVAEDGDAGDSVVGEGEDCDAEGLVGA